MAWILQNPHHDVFLGLSILSTYWGKFGHWKWMASESDLTSFRQNKIFYIPNCYIPSFFLQVFQHAFEIIIPKDCKTFPDQIVWPPSWSPLNAAYPTWGLKWKQIQNLHSRPSNSASAKNAATSSCLSESRLCRNAAWITGLPFRDQHLRHWQEGMQTSACTFAVSPSQRHPAHFCCEEGKHLQSIKFIWRDPVGILSWEI